MSVLNVDMARTIMRSFNPKAAFCSLVLISLTGCVRDGDYRRLTADYAERDASADAQKSFAEGDYRIYAAMGVGRFYPGLEQKSGAALADRYGERTLARTSDVVESAAHMNYMNISVRYAGEFNRSMSALLKGARALSR